MGHEGGSTEWLNNEALFSSQLREGHRFAERVAGVIRSSGLMVEVTPFILRESVSQRHRFHDEFDLLVAGRRVEVKSRGVCFSGPNDYPFETAFVYSSRGWKAKRRRPVAIVLVSQRTGGTAVVPVSTELQWIRRRVRDRVREIDYEVLEIRRELLRSLDSFVEWLKRGGGDG